MPRLAPVIKMTLLVRGMYKLQRQLSRSQKGTLREFAIMRNVSDTWT